MKIRVSDILKLIAVLFFITGLFLLWKGHPIKPTSIDQTKLYESPMYLFLASDGEKTKAWVTSVDNVSHKTNIVINFFTNEGVVTEAKIYDIKVNYIVGDFVSILYNPQKTNEARIKPSDERSLGWSDFGWCFIMGFMLYLIGYVRNKKSAGLE